MLKTIPGAKFGSSVNRLKWIPMASGRVEFNGEMAMHFCTALSMPFLIPQALLIKRSLFFTVNGSYFS